MFNVKERFDGMVFSKFMCNLLQSSVYPHISKLLMENISTQTISFSNIIECIGVMIIGMIWNKWANKLFKNYILFSVIDVLSYIAILIFLFITGDFDNYYIIGGICVSFITKNITFADNKVKSIRYDSPEKREKYDNNCEIAYAISTILGSIFSMCLISNIYIAFLISLLANIIDNFIYSYIYIKTTKKRI